MDRPKIVIEFQGAQELEREFQQHLGRGGTVVKQLVGAAVGDLCEVVVVHPVHDARMALPATVSFVAGDPAQPAVAVVFDGFDDTLREKLRLFVESRPATPAAAQPRNKTGAAKDRRNLNENERFNVAKEGDMGQRIQLEKRYGKMVWEMLLRNPRISRPEVARIAKRGDLPKPLRDLIINNRSWTSDGGVRRALLSNPRLNDQELKKVLRSAPQHELKLLSKAGMGSPKVRRAATQLLTGR